MASYEGCKSYAIKYVNRFYDKGIQNKWLEVFSIKFGQGKLTKEKVSIYKVTPVTHPLLTYQFQTVEESVENRYVQVLYYQCLCK